MGGIDQDGATPHGDITLGVLQGMTKREITWIARVTLPFFFLMCAAILIVYFFPTIVTFLPAHMKN